MLALLLAAPLGAQVHRCVMADGRVEYRDRACPGDAVASSTKVIAPPQSALRAAMGPWRCGDDPAARTHAVFTSRLVREDVAALPTVQRDSLQAALGGVALGNCGLHGQGCGDTRVAAYRERNGVVFACVDGRRGLELRVLPDGRIVSLRAGATRARVLNPRVPLDHPDSDYRIDLDGNRLSDPMRGPGAAPRLEVLERER
jgi:hypothetical protein